MLPSITFKTGHIYRYWTIKYILPVASMALAICRREKPISSKGTAIAGGGGEVESLLLGSDKAEAKEREKCAWLLHTTHPVYIHIVTMGLQFPRITQIQHILTNKIR